MKNCKKIGTEIRKSVKSWQELCRVVLSEAKTVPEVTIDSELLEQLMQHCFYAGYIESDPAIRAGNIDIGVHHLDPIHHLWYIPDYASLVDPYPYFEK